MRDLLSRSAKLYVDDHGTLFNQHLVDLLQVQSMLRVAEMNAVVSLAREESRGGHYRTDFPKMDNERFFQHSLVRRGKDSEPVLDKLEVTVEDIMPEAEVKY